MLVRRGSDDRLVLCHFSPSKLSNRVNHKTYQVQKQIVVQSLSHIRLFANPMNHSTPGFPVPQGKKFENH